MMVRLGRIAAAGRMLDYLGSSNEVGALAQIAERLAQAGINMEYAYCTSSSQHNAGAIVLRTNDLEATINALS